MVRAEDSTVRSVDGMDLEAASTAHSLKKLGDEEGGRVGSWLRKGYFVGLIDQWIC